MPARAAMSRAITGVRLAAAALPARCGNSTDADTGQPAGTRRRLRQRGRSEEEPLLIAEQLMLLLLDPERGELDVRHDATDPDRLAAAALLLDLAEQRNLGHRNGHVAFHARFPSGHPLLEAAGEALAAAGPGLPLGVGARPDRNAHASGRAHAARRAAPPRPPASDAPAGMVAVGAHGNIRCARSQARNEALAMLRDGRTAHAAARARAAAADRLRRTSRELSRCGRAHARDRIVACARAIAGRPAMRPTPLLGALRATLLDD